jgi:hypothetical protein
VISRKSSVTAESLDAYRNLIKDATDDLEAHLQNIDEKLENIFENAGSGSGSNVTELQLIKDERKSTQKCLQICAQLSDHINQIQLTPQHGDNSTGHKDPESIPERLTFNGLQECKNSLTVTAAKLERHMKDLVDRLVTKSKAATNSEEDLAELARLREELDSARQCIDICSQADIHLKETVSTIDNYATGDAVQFMVSTDGTIIHGTNRGLGWRTRQVGGHVSDATIQQISRDFSSINFQNIANESLSSRGNTQTTPDDGTEHKLSSEFRERYGPGFKLTSKTTADLPVSSTGSADNEPSSSVKR